MRFSLGTFALLVVAASCSDSTSPPGLPADMQLVSGGAAITARVGDTLAPIVVQMRDANGRAVPGVPVVAWGTVDPVSVGRTDYGVDPLDSVVFTDQSGRASIRMIAPTLAGTGTITVQIGNVPTDQSATRALGATIPITTTAGPFAQLVAHRMQRFAGATFPIDSLFTSADTYGNPVSASSMTAVATNGWSVSGTTLTPPSATYVGSTVLTATAGSVSAPGILNHWRESRCTGLVSICLPGPFCMHPPHAICGSPARVTLHLCDLPPSRRMTRSHRRLLRRAA